MQQRSRNSVVGVAACGPFRGFAALLLACGALLLAACGQRGPLMLPGAKPAAAPLAAPVPMAAPASASKPAPTTPNAALPAAPAASSTSRTP